MEEKETNRIRQYIKQKPSQCDPQIPRQNYCLLSFMLLPKPERGVIGFVKPRGVYDDIDSATRGAEDIINGVDSVFPVHIAHVGYWNPITNNEEFSSDQLDVHTNEIESSLRDKAAKESVAKVQQQQREIAEKKEEIRHSSSCDDDDEESLNFYTKKKVSYKELSNYITSGEEKLKELKMKKLKLYKTINNLGFKHPEYQDQWLDNYNNARKKAGLLPISEDDFNKMQVFGAPLIDTIDY